MRGKGPDAGATGRGAKQAAETNGKEIARIAAVPQPGNGYVVTPFRTVISVRGIVSVHYFEFSKNWAFPGESHPFWEMVYLDKGEAEITAGSRVFTARAGTVIFHKPGEFHTIHANGSVAPNIFIAAFDCHSPAMARLEGRVLRAGPTEKELMGRMVAEARAAYSSPLDDPWLKQLRRRPDAPLGSEQMIRVGLEELLIRILRGSSPSRPAARDGRQEQDRLFADVCGFLSARPDGSLRFIDVCRQFCCSGSVLKGLFRARTGVGVMAYYRRLRVEEARRMIREGAGNFSEIAVRLGFGDGSYFSRCFKRCTGMTPTEYARSIQALEQGDRPDDR